MVRYDYAGNLRDNHTSQERIGHARELEEIYQVSLGPGR
jgi:hypothetical protein